jgi:hypothetical protein
MTQKLIVALLHAVKRGTVIHLTKNLALSKGISGGYSIKYKSKVTRRSRADEAAELLWATWQEELGTEAQQEKHDDKRKPNLYVLSIARAYLRAPSHSAEEDLLEEALHSACERDGLDAGEVVESLVNGVLEDSGSPNTEVTE